MKEAFIPTAMSAEEMVLIYKAVDTMCTALMANKHRITDPEMLEDAYKYRKLKTKLGQILDLAEELEQHFNKKESSDDVSYSEREKE
jgi:hypothetical protein